MLRKELRMDDSIQELRQELFSAVVRMRRASTHPPVPVGVTPAEGQAMIAIARLEQQGASVRSGEVAKCSHSTPSAMSQVLKSLEEKGFITRQRSAGDCRGVTVHLTEQGWELETRHRRMRDRRLNEALAYLGQDDAREFVRIVKRLSEFNATHPWTVAEEDIASGFYNEASVSGPEVQPGRTVEQGDAPCA